MNQRQVLVRDFSMTVILSLSKYGRQGLRPASFDTVLRTYSG